MSFQSRQVHVPSKVFLKQNRFKESCKQKTNPLSTVVDSCIVDCCVFAITSGGATRETVNGTVRPFRPTHTRIQGQLTRTLCTHTSAPHPTPLLLHLSGWAGGLLPPLHRTLHFPFLIVAFSECDSCSSCCYIDVLMLLRCFF